MFQGVLHVERLGADIVLSVGLLTTGGTTVRFSPTGVKVADSAGIPLIRGYRSKSNINIVTKHNENSIDWGEYKKSLKTTSTTSEVNDSVAIHNSVSKPLEGTAN